MKLPNPKASAFPVPRQKFVDNEGDRPRCVTIIEQFGVSKRELIAAMALQGYLAGRNNVACDSTKGYVAAACVSYADALLAELDRAP